jgi:subtilisin family serine protease
MKSFLPLLHFFLVLTLMVPAAFVGEPVQAADALPVVQAGDAPSHASDRILIKFASGVAPRATVQGALATGHASLDGLLSAYQVQAAHRLFKSAPESDPVGLAQIHVLRLKPETDLDTLLALLETDPNVEWAEPDYLAFAAATTPNDPLFVDQWGLAKIQAAAAWDVTTGSATIPIAIVDSGIDFTHPDLSGKLWVNPGEIAGNGLDDDNNGYVDDVQGWDLVNADNAPADDNGHGTQVAGIAAASTNNGAGIAGVCWACKIMPVKVMQASGVANYSDIAAGVLYAAQKGARVINLSLGGYSYSSALDAAIQAATGTYGAVIVAGAGNDNLSTPFYPAAYPDVLAVAGTDPADAKAALSNYGAWVDVSAPAVDIKTTFMGGDYGDVDGTSYAAPFVAGVAGLLRSQNPDWSPDMVRAQVIHTADDIDPLNPGLEGQIGSGRVNADQAVRTPAQPLLSLYGYTVDGVANGRPEPGSTVDLGITLYNDWGDAASVQTTLTSSSAYVTVVNGSGSFAAILNMDRPIDLNPLRLAVGQFIVKYWPENGLP